MEKIIYSKNKEETMALGHRLVNILPNGSVVKLTGDLGAGKTTLVRGIAEALHIKEVVQSPTFNIMKIYFKGDKPLIHIDAYRLADINTDIGLDEYIGYPTGLTVIEWPEFIIDQIPEEAIEITITHVGDDNRKIIVNGDNDILEAL